MRNKKRRGQNDRADCPDHLCLKQKAVDSTGGTIVCLPNKVVIEGEKVPVPMKPHRNLTLLSDPYSTLQRKTL